MRLTACEKRTLNGLLHKILELRDKSCLRCGKSERLQISHIYPKGRYRRMEYEPDNVKFLCDSCHLYWWHKNPIEAGEWIRQVLPKERLDRLKLMAQTTGPTGFNYKLHKLYLEQEVKKYVQRF